MVTHLRHLGVVKIFWVVFDILFGDKFLDLCWTFCLLTKFWLGWDILLVDKILPWIGHFVCWQKCWLGWDILKFLSVGLPGLSTGFVKSGVVFVFMVNFWPGRLHFLNNLISWNLVIFLVIEAVFTSVWCKVMYYGFRLWCVSKCQACQVSILFV